jgi:hypothetical protein
LVVGVIYNDLHQLTKQSKFMKLDDAAKILNITGDITPESTKTAYRQASSKYHPDKGGSVQMMQAVNEAYEQLKDYTGPVTSGDDNYPEELNDAINAVSGLEGLDIEICGAWVWITGNTKAHAKALGKNGAGYFYASKKQAWYFRPSDWKSTGRGKFSLQDIRNTHGTQSIKAKSKPQLMRA